MGKGGKYSYHKSYGVIGQIDNGKGKPDHLRKNPERGMRNTIKWEKRKRNK